MFPLNVSGKKEGRHAYQLNVTQSGGEVVAGGRFIGVWCETWLGMLIKGMLRGTRVESLM